MGTPDRSFGPISSPSRHAWSLDLFQRSGSLESVAPPLNSIPSPGWMAPHAWRALVHAEAASSLRGHRGALLDTSDLPREDGCPAADQWRPAVSRRGGTVDPSLGVSTPVFPLPPVVLLSGAESSSHSGPAADRRARTRAFHRRGSCPTRAGRRSSRAGVLPPTPPGSVASRFCQRRRGRGWLATRTHAGHAPSAAAAACRRARRATYGAYATQAAIGGARAPSVCVLAVLARVGTPARTKRIASAAAASVVPDMPIHSPACTPRRVGVPAYIFVCGTDSRPSLGRTPRRPCVARRHRTACRPAGRLYHIERLPSSRLPFLPTPPSPTPSLRWEAPIPRVPSALSSLNPPRICLVGSLPNPNPDRRCQPPLFFCRCLPPAPRPARAPTPSPRWTRR